MKAMPSQTKTQRFIPTKSLGKMLTQVIDRRGWMPVNFGLKKIVDFVKRTFLRKNQNFEGCLHLTES